jgi:signal peptidase II
MTEIVQGNQKASMLKRALIIIFSALLIDQVIKIWIKTSMTLDDHKMVLGKYLQLYFIENNGMAFGMQLGEDWGKIALTVFRILACILIFWFIYDLSKKSNDKFKMAVFALIFAGAAGNTIDCIFYGQLFNASTYNQVATMFPSGGGYSTLFKGKVVDMFYCEIFNIHRSEASWLPNFLFGPDDRWIFFRPIFNFADACISVGVVMLIIWQKRFFGKKGAEKVKA